MDVGVGKMGSDDEDPEALLIRVRLGIPEARLLDDVGRHEMVLVDEPEEDSEGTNETW